MVVLSAAMLAVLGLSAIAGSAAAGRMLVACPQVSGLVPCCGPPVAQLSATQPCCPVPVAGCCTATASDCCATPTDCCTATTCAQALTIGATPDPAVAGDAATISGTLTGGTIAAQPVALWQELAGQTAFSQVAETKTDSSGGFRFVRTVQTNAHWYAMTGTVTSPDVDEPVSAAVALHTSRFRHRAGAKLTLSGSITPSHAGERVALQQLRGRRWVTIARPRLGANSRFAIAERLAPTVERFRIVLAADARNARTVSAVVAVSVS